MIGLLLFLLVVVALAASTFWIYLRAELPVRGNRALATLRTAVLALIVLLLFDPAMPWGGGQGAGGPWVLLDASLSMAAGDGSAWDEAVERARVLQEEGWRIVRFGQGLSEAIAEGAPEALETRLAPALARAAEAGVTRVRVLSDLRFDDPVAVRSALATSSGRVEFEGFGEGVVNVGIASFAVEDQLGPGDSTFAELELFAASAGDSVVVEFREEGTLVATATREAPAPGLRDRARVGLPPAAESGRRRYTATVRAPGDAFPSDDEAVAYMSAGHDAGGLVLASLRPDWEARSLLTTLERATGLRATGYLRVAPDRFLPMGPAYLRGPAVDSTTVAAAVSDAALTVIHGLGAEVDAWGRSLPSRAARALLWPTDAVGAEVAGVQAGAPRSGEWYASADLPASPLAGDLSGARLQDLPPLSDVLTLGSDQDGLVPLRVQLAGTGPAQPALILLRSGGRRTAVALASGFWRWDARDGEARDAYRRLWSGVGGWLLEEDRMVTAGEPRPEKWVFGPGETVTWRLPGGEGDSVSVTVSDAGGIAFDGTLPAGSGVGTSVLEPGGYDYRVVTSDGTAFEGRLDVEPRTLEMLPARFTPDPTGSERADTATGGRSGPPLSTSPWLFLLALALVSAEWIWRRRVGLR